MKTELLCITVLKKIRKVLHRKYQKYLNKNFLDNIFFFIKNNIFKINSVNFYKNMLDEIKSLKTNWYQLILITGYLLVFSIHLWVNKIAATSDQIYIVIR